MKLLAEERVFFRAFFFRKRNIREWVKERELGLKAFMQDV